MITVERTMKEKLIDWLDAQVNFYTDETYFNDKIYNVSSMCCLTGARKSLHVSDVRKIARIIGVKVIKEPWDDDKNKVYFEYRGFEVFTLVWKRRK